MGFIWFGAVWFLPEKAAQTGMKWIIDKMKFNYIKYTFCIPKSFDTNISQVYDYKITFVCDLTTREPKFKR